MASPDDEVFAFVLMPFDVSFDDAYRLGIKETAAALDIRCERVDEQIYAGGILDRIYRQIDAADIIIADMSGQNANVFYEVGYAHAKDKLCLLLTKSAEELPFDLKHRRHIVYGSSIRTLREKLVNELEWAKSEIKNVRKSRIRVHVSQIQSDLDKTNHTATAKLQFQIDLHNDSDLPSAEIEAMYFYTRNDWEVHQGGAKCSRTESDLPDFRYRHFLQSPIKRLQRSGWAQIAFQSQRLLAASWRGEVLKDSYPISGRSTLRLVTDKGAIDYDIFVKLVAEVSIF